MEAVNAGVPAKFDVAMVGVGPTSFISNAAHRPGLRGSEMFNIAYGAVHPEKRGDRRWFQEVERLPRGRVACGLDELLSRLERSGRNPVFDICTPTPLHADQICKLAKWGAKTIITDKPIVTCTNELRQIMDATDNGKKVKVFITFNHRYTAPVFRLREIVAEDPSKVEGIDGGFLQHWLETDPECPQGDWRIEHPLCGLVDLETHVADLCSFVAGSDIKSVINGRIDRAGEFAKEKGFSDCGSADFTFAQNGIVGSGRYHQSLPGHSDDIYVLVTMKNGIRYLWRMEWGSDTLFEANTTLCSSTLLESRDHWKANLRGDSDLFDDTSTNDQFGETPPGHIPGWPSYWLRQYHAIAGNMLRAEDHPCVDHLPPVMQLPVPMLQDAGVHVTKYVEAHVRSSENDGAEVSMADIEI
jgi:predicted dehydrogenase